MAGQIIQRGERTWMVRVFRGRDPKTGKRRYLDKTIHGTKKDAQQYLNGVLRDIDLGVYVEPSEMTANEFFDKWLETAARPRLRERTFENYRGNLELHVRPVIGERRLSSVMPLDVQRVLTRMQERGLKALTVRRCHTILSSAFSQAVKWRLLQHNPAAGAELPRAAREEMLTLTPPEVRLFLEAARARGQYLTLFGLAIASGLRPSELLGLQWKDMDWEEGALTVQRGLYHRPGGKWYFAEPKTQQARRTVPLPAPTVAELRAHRRRQAEGRLSSAGYRDRGLLFADDAGEPLTVSQMRHNFKVTVQRAGLAPRIRLYDLRHTCVTLLLVAGVNPKVVSERLGHSSIKITLDIYTHVLPEMQQQAAERLESLLFGA